MSRERVRGACSGWGVDGPASAREKCEERRLKGFRLGGVDEVPVPEAFCTRCSSSGRPWWSGGRRLPISEGAHEAGRALGCGRGRWAEAPDDCAWPMVVGRPAGTWRAGRGRGGGEDVRVEAREAAEDLMYGYSCGYGWSCCSRLAAGGRYTAAPSHCASLFSPPRLLFSRSDCLSGLACWPNLYLALYALHKHHGRCALACWLSC